MKLSRTVLVFAVAAAALAPANSLDAGEQVRALVEADWTQWDADFRAAKMREPAPLGAGRRDIPSFSLLHTQKVLEEARALAERLSRLQSTPPNLPALEAQLAKLDRAAAQDGMDWSETQRKTLHFAARSLKRRIAFANPLLDFDEILFIKRHDPEGEFHMCDQYYGFNAVPGGGVFVLSEPFSDSPRVRDLLAGRCVANGRLWGTQLDQGSFLSPELSYDAKTLYFAYTEDAGRYLEWSPETCYHLFRYDLEAGELTQLTDGPWNDFDPCVLPSDRIVFVSERRGGFLRCGRHCPTYALYSMKPDGSGIACFSYHETHEWHPSVTRDGMVVYTRWDYVDRDTNVAHHIWTCYPDGSDPRSFHGNYPELRRLRPWMEMSIRQVPGSHKFVATAAAHHGHAFGSLVLIDPRVEDDSVASQLERITPDVPFPEAERSIRPIRRCMVYGTPWPLSEDDYLCVYGADAKNRGIYWLDRDGNKELLYRDPAISCLSPMPLRPRPRPPVIPTTATGEGDATVAVMDVYNSDFDWPENTRIEALRIIQLLPKTTAPPNTPRIGIGNQTNARSVLGTVPVEDDGSAHFTVPAGRAVYFQALDDKGEAVQSMRSVTYLQPGGRLTCLGCHERKHGASPETLAMPSALRRPPSALEPEVMGSHPFSYVRMVQPVLDKHCVGCHEKEQALDLSGTVTGKHGWTQSYQNLAGKYGFYFNVRNGSINDGIHGGSRTIPGAFGAKASRLLDYLDGEHYGVDLSAGERRRITLWLDCNSEFYGAYEDTYAQSRGEIVEPALY